jgi:hypothetical protein
MCRRRSGYPGAHQVVDLVRAITFGKANVSRLHAIRLMEHVVSAGCYVKIA